MRYLVMEPKVKLIWAHSVTVDDSWSVTNADVNDNSFGDMEADLWNLLQLRKIKDPRKRAEEFFFRWTDISNTVFLNRGIVCETCFDWAGVEYADSESALCDHYRFSRSWMRALYFREKQDEDTRGSIMAYLSALKTFESPVVIRPGRCSQYCKSALDRVYRNELLQRRRELAEARIDMFGAKTPPVKEKKLYLMKCNRTGFYKIGVSVNPKFRETTLQAEQPAVRLVGEWHGADYEYRLHQKFSDVRVRGEWFNLSPSQVQLIAKHAAQNKLEAIL